MVATVIPANLSDYSVALVEFFSEPAHRPEGEVYVVYIDTGWSAADWNDRVESVRLFTLSKGFHWIALKSSRSFDELVKERGDFPTRKFQWCASLLKGLPLLTWLDEVDLHAEWIVCIPKVQYLTRQPIPEVIEASSFHGDRCVKHPLLHHSPEAIQALLTRSKLPILGGRSLECQPCIHQWDTEPLLPADRKKISELEQKIQKKLTFQPIMKGSLAYDRFSLGCADPFGCGL